MKLKTKFQDEDFDLGEVADVDIATLPDGRIKVQTRAKYSGLQTFLYQTKAEFDADWEDAPEEPKEYWYINEYGTVTVSERYGRYTIYDESKKNFGNCFETKEEAEKAVEKLKAWKRLKDKGFRFCGGDDACISYETDIENWSMQDLQDFKVLFGGGE